MTTAYELCARAAQMNIEGRSDEAYDLQIRALSSDPDDLTALAAVRDAALSRRQFDVALTLARRIVKLVPEDGAQWDRLAGVLMNFDRFDEARIAVDKALELAPDNPTHWHQAALLAHRSNRPDDAMAFAQNGLALNPYGTPLLHDVAHMLLAKGDDLPAALEAYEVRWETLRHLPAWDLHLPEWQGEHLIGKRLLLHSEQGNGDAIMLARFARDLVRVGAEIVGLGVPTELTRLFAAQRWPRVRVVDMSRLERDDWDCHVPMFSVLRYLKYQQGDIDGSPYLETVPRIVVPPLPEGRRVGICWASGRRNVDTGLRRYLPLSSLLVFTEIPGVRLVSLQKGPEAGEIYQIGAAALVNDPMPACDDFAATAAIVAQLDAVVTVDTAVLHLAAAMGKPTFMMCQYSRCWRWWNFPSGRPWYDTLTAATQDVPRDWTKPIAAAERWLRNRM